MEIYVTADPSQVTDGPIFFGWAATEPHARGMVAEALGVDSLRGLKQVPTGSGIRYYAPGADDDSGASATIEY